MIRTRRLLLRRWTQEDRAPFQALNEDPDVAYWLGGPRFTAWAGEALGRYNQLIDERGFGKFAVERLEDRTLIGAVGVSPVPPRLPIEGFEIGWVLARSAWGQGYASEAASAALAHAFDRGLEEIVSFTAPTNLRSQSVMERIGMVRDPARDFSHPELEPGHPLRRHLVHVARRAWFSPGS